MPHMLSTARVRLLGLPLLATLLIGAAIAPAFAGANPPQGGAPLEAEVRMQSLMGVPPEGYSMVCTSLPACVTGGNIDLETKAKVPVAFDPRTMTTHGVGALPFTKADGSVQMSWDCGGDGGRATWKMTPTGTEAGELEVLDVQAVSGSNALAVRLDPGGASGGDFPQEIIDRSDGGCGTPVRHISQKMGTWYHQFHLAAREGSVEQFGDVRLDGLTWKDGVYTRTIDRFVNVGYAPYTYPLYERTTIEVEPEYCPGSQNRVASATSDGSSLGIDGMSFYPGQQFTAPPKSRIKLADGSEIRLDKGGSFTVSDCGDGMTELSVTKSIGKLWVHLKHLVGAGSKKFDVVTPRAVAGARGTIFEVSYKSAKQLTRVGVTESEVSLKGRNGAKGKVMVKPGQVGVQKGKKAPRIVKR